MCNCLNIRHTDYDTDVCIDCGRENQAPLSIVRKYPPTDMSPFPAGYSRSKRFRKILDCVLDPTPSAADNLMLEQLLGKSFDDIGALMGAM